MTIGIYAVVNGGVVTNIVTIDSADTATISALGAVAIPAGSPAAIGWLYDGTNFTDPAYSTLASAQAAQVEKLTRSCASAIVSGFQSSALGAAHTYPSEPIDQSNLIGCVTASQSPGIPSTWSCNFWCADSTGAWAFQAHTAAQIQQVLADGVTQRESYSSKLASLKAQVAAATTVSQVQSIVW